MYNRRKILFEKFSNQLKILKNSSLIEVNLKYPKTYICPLCLSQFEEEDLISNESKNSLTEEDAPPASLGGSRIALTCKKCNSHCGHEIDYQLKLFTENYENKKFLKGSVQLGTITDQDSEPTNVKLTSRGDGFLEVRQNKKHNNPLFLNQFISRLTKDKNVHFIPKKTKLDSKKVEYALLKTNYLITFSKFGYLFLLDKAYDNIRKQILNPDQEIIKRSLTLSNHHFKNNIGTHYILNDKAKSIFNIFKLKSTLSEFYMGSFIPAPTTTIDMFWNEIKINLTNDNITTLELSKYDTKVDLFENIEEIKKIINWIYKI